MGKGAKGGSGPSGCRRILLQENEPPGESRPRAVSLRVSPEDTLSPFLPSTIAGESGPGHEEGLRGEGGSVAPLPCCTGPEWTQVDPTLLGRVRGSRGLALGLETNMV